MSPKRRKPARRSARSQADFHLSIERLETRSLLSVSPPTPELLKDINTITQSSSPTDIVGIGSEAYFAADDGVHGAELWKSDGTSSGTMLVDDINPGSGSSAPSNLTVVGSELYFDAQNSSGATQLWVSDGTSSGTAMVANVGAQDLFNFGGVLYFDTNSSGTYELWKSDGTSSGTQPYFSGGPSMQNATVVNGELYVTGSGPSSSVELWTTDGTSSGTTLVDNLAGTDLNDLVNFNGTLFFRADDGTHVNALWQSDGTSSGTQPFTDGSGHDLSLSASGQSTSGTLYNDNGVLLFDATNGTLSGLWATDGTTSGTTLLASDSALSAHDFVSTGSEVFFAANDGSHGTALWSTDGTSSGTQVVADADAGDLTNVGGTLFFVATGSHGSALWTSNGTSSGTLIVADGTTIAPLNALGLANVGGTLFFQGEDQSHGAELFTSDGTSAGTLLVDDINLNSYGSDAANFTNVNGTVYFTTNVPDRIDEFELWKTDETSSGTVLVADVPAGLVQGRDFFVRIAPKPLVYGPRYLTNVEGKLYFVTSDTTGATELWTSDGTSSGTVMFDLFPGNAYPPLVSNLTNVDGSLFFTVNEDETDGSSFSALFEYSGSGNITEVLGLTQPAGTTQTIVTFIDNLVNDNGTLFFQAESNGSATAALWRTDGTSSGTTQVSPAGLVGAAYLSNVNGILYFAANDGTHGTELWKSDGTTSGTLMVDDIFTGSYSSNPKNLLNVNGTLFFTAYDGAHGTELWSSDGSSSGTSLVADINSAGASAYPSNLTNVNGRLYFAANDGTHGVELWTSDGTSSGTTLVADVDAGSGSGDPVDLVSVGSEVFFVATDGTHGLALWGSDGTSSGTTIVQNLTGSATYSASANLASVGGVLFYAAYDAQHGYEPWTYTPVVLGTGSYAPTPINYLPQSGALAVDPALVLDHSAPTFPGADTGMITGATVSISTGFVAGEDVLGFNSQFGISGSYNDATGVLTLSGTATAAEYQLALRSVTYSNTSLLPIVQDRTFTFTADQGLANGVVDEAQISIAATIGSTQVYSGTSGTDTFEVHFLSPTTGEVLVNGVQDGTFDTTVNSKLTFTGTGGNTTVIVFDSFSTDWTETMTLGSATFNSSSLEIDISNVNIIYGYTQSAVATLTAPASSFIVGVGNGDYTYLSNGTNLYTEVSGAQDVTATTLSADAYVYFYGGTGGSAQLAKQASWAMTGSTGISVSGFPQVYAVGATDGSDQINLVSPGEKLVVTPAFTYVTDNVGDYLIGALYAKSVGVVDTTAAGTAYFDSYAGDAFVGGVGTSQMSGAMLAGNSDQFSTFNVNAQGFSTVYVFASGAGTDTVTMNSNGYGMFVGTTAYSTLSIGSSESTVHQYIDAETLVPSAIGFSLVTVSGTGDADDQAQLFDASGTNQLTAGGTTANLTTAFTSQTVNNFSQVTAYAGNGVADNLHQDAIDFALTTVGNWTSD